MLSTPMLDTAIAVRAASRNNSHTTTTSGLAPTYLQANLLILPSRYASDFRLLCARNPVPCPLIAESLPGQYHRVKSYLKDVPDEAIAASLDIRRDIPKYMVYHDGQLVKSHCEDVVSEWTDDHVAFLVGCSFSFESALTEASLEPRHSSMQRTVPMYRTSIPLCPAGVFTGSTYVVSLRVYKRQEVENVRNITRPYTATHGEPIAWGWDALKTLGIRDIDIPEWGEPPLTADGRPLSQVEGSEDEIPMFWGCGVTPQNAAMKAGLQGTVMAHAPGHMLLLDCRDWDIVAKA